MCLQLISKKPFFFVCDEHLFDSFLMEGILYFLFFTFSCFVFR